MLNSFRVIRNMGISMLEFSDNDMNVILLRALCVDITGRVLSARNCYKERRRMGIIQLFSLITLILFGDNGNLNLK